MSTDCCNTVCYNKKSCHCQLDMTNPFVIPGYLIILMGSSPLSHYHCCQPTYSFNRRPSEEFICKRCCCCIYLQNIRQKVVFGQFSIIVSSPELLLGDKSCVAHGIIYSVNLMFMICMIVVDHMGICAVIFVLLLGCRNSCK